MNGMEKTQMKKNDHNVISDLLMEYGQDSVMDDKTIFHDIHNLNHLLP